MPRTLTLPDEPPAVAESLQGDQAREHAARLFQAHGRFVLRAVLRLGVGERDAQDACQEVFLTALRRHEQLLGTARETTWLYGICLRVAANYRRKAHRRYERQAPEAPETGREPGLEEDLDARRLMQRLDAALGRISDKKREVFVLFEFAERDMEEIAAILGVPLKTCYSRLYAARAELQTALAQSEVRP